MPKLALGTAQFGFAYGIASSGSEMSDNALSAIVKMAVSNGIDTFDTATAYGNSEIRLGNFQLEQIKIVTKIPKGSENFEQMIQGSLKHLRLQRVYGVLIHSSSDFVRYEKLTALKAAGLCEKIGVSVYEPQELELLERYPADLVQLPCNVFDRRFIESGWLKRLSQMGVEIHVRSVFLQGLLLMGNRPSYFNRWQKIWDAWENYLFQTNQSPLEACLNFAKNLQEVSKVIIGVDSLEQFRQIVSFWGSRSQAQIPNFDVNDVELLNPSRWLKS